MLRRSGKISPHSRNGHLASRIPGRAWHAHTDSCSACVSASHPDSPIPSRRRETRTPVQRGTRTRNARGRTVLVRSPPLENRTGRPKRIAPIHQARHACCSSCFVRAPPSARMSKKRDRPALRSKRGPGDRAGHFAVPAAVPFVLEKSPVDPPRPPSAAVYCPILFSAHSLQALPYELVCDRKVERRVIYTVEQIGQGNAGHSHRDIDNLCISDACLLDLCHYIGL